VRFIYVGSASLEETFIGEVAEWAAKNQRDISLHVVGDNISPRVWNFLKSLYAPNITVNTRGVRYEHLPDLLKSYDIGLVLYKANTLNFIYNVPNKVFEYLAADLEVWYPRQMTGIRHFHSVNPKLPLREIDFRNLTDVLPVASEGRPKAAGFTCEEALAPLIEAFSSSPELE
jgi:hypothetical protein